MDGFPPVGVGSTNWCQGASLSSIDPYEVIAQEVQLSYSAGEVNSKYRHICMAQGLDLLIRMKRSIVSIVVQDWGSYVVAILM